jgi:magnesium-transporting ATPase (P-type)
MLLVVLLDAAAVSCTCSTTTITAAIAAVPTVLAGDHPVTARAIARSVNIMPGLTVDEVAEQRGCSKEVLLSNDAEMDKVLLHGASVFSLRA